MGFLEALADPALIVPALIILPTAFLILASTQRWLSVRSVSIGMALCALVLIAREFIFILGTNGPTLEVIPIVLIGIGSVLDWKGS